MKLPEIVPKFHDSNGPLAAKLLQSPSSFGLGTLPIASHPDSTTVSVCGYCSTGCGLRIHLKDGQAIGLTPANDYPVNIGMACVKGWEALAVLKSDERAATPLLRDDQGILHEIDWAVAGETFCNRFKELQSKYGPGSVAFISTGQIPTEEMAFLGCLAKFGMGMLHGDGNTRQCMATSVVAYKQSFGFDAPPFTYSDLEESDCLVFIGANPCIGHPILWQRVLANKNNAELIVVDPRRTETAMAASDHLAIAPKSDLVLLYGIAKELIEMGAVDNRFIANSTEGYEEFRDFVSRFPMNKVSIATGVSIEKLQRVVQKIANAKRASFWWTMGVNQSHQGVRTAQAIINLALMTGSIGRPGTGANSITGQCNAMGSRLYSNTTSMIGHYDFLRDEDRQKIATILEIPVSSIPNQNSYAYDQIISGIDSGEIRGLWIVATNTAHSWINSPRAKALLSKLDFLVVQDMYRTTDTAMLADLVLPAAGWGEKEGTFINSERRFGPLKKVAKAPGVALADFAIFRFLADVWGCGEMFVKWTHPEAVFQIMKRITEGQPCDITGIRDYKMLDECGGIQWPWTASDQKLQGIPQRERRLFEDGRFFHTNGKAKFLFEEPKSIPEGICDTYPYLLLTGRGTVSQWHTETRTSKSPVLRTLYPKLPYVEIHPNDAEDLGIMAGDQVHVRSRRGTATVKAVITASLRRGNVFMPMHDAQTNRLTLEHVDPMSRQPAYKDCAVQILR